MRKILFYHIKKKKHGFTLIELLVIIAVLGLLASIVLVSLSNARGRTRDSDRVQSFVNISKGLEAFYVDHGYYPKVCASLKHGFSYAQRNADGSCGSGVTLWFDNSASEGFLDSIFPEYINRGNWEDPLNPAADNNLNNKHNCRYAIPKFEAGCNFANKQECKGDGQSEGDPLDCKPQKYFLHCTLEGDSNIAKNDGGTHDQVFEISFPDEWICLTTIPE